MRVLAGLLLALLSVPGLVAQVRPDYLSPEEVEQVREARDPNDRAELFLEFAEKRLRLVESAFAGLRPDDPRDPEDLSALVENYLRALDDAAATIDTALERGGVDLSDTREKTLVKARQFRARLKEVEPTDERTSDILLWDFEEALMATDDLLKLAEDIPEDFIPPRRPGRVAGEKKAAPPQGPPGRPTLKRPDEEKKDDDRR